MAAGCTSSSRVTPCPESETLRAEQVGQGVTGTTAVKSPSRPGLKSMVTSMVCSGLSGESPGGLTTKAVASPPAGSSMRTEVTAWPSLLLSENDCALRSPTTTSPKSKASLESVARPRTAWPWMSRLADGASGASVWSCRLRWWVPSSGGR